MSLIELWKSNHNSLFNKKLVQIISFAGDGKLRDDSITMSEFREYLKLVPNKLLTKYVDECLTLKFEDSGFALQDIVNEIGSRLSFEVDYGIYKGTRNKTGYDGLWKLPNDHFLIVEVKTTDAYRINIESIIKYGEALDDKEILANNLTFLYVVGRQDTGGLESQVRGSRYAWNIRIISVESLLSLLYLKEDIGDPHLISKITRILIPQEFTRLDGIVDLVFSTADDLVEIPESDSEAMSVSNEDTLSELSSKPSDFHLSCARKVGDKLNIELKKKTRTIYTSECGDSTLCVLVSKEYDKYPGKLRYWFSLRPYHIEALEAKEKAYVAFGCESPDLIFMIPYQILKSHMSHFRVTPKGNKTYWHIEIFGKNKKYRFGCSVNSKCETSDITEYII